MWLRESAGFAVMARGPATEQVSAKHPSEPLRSDNTGVRETMQRTTAPSIDTCVNVVSISARHSPAGPGVPCPPLVGLFSVVVQGGLTMETCSSPPVGRAQVTMHTNLVLMAGSAHTDPTGRLL